MIICAPTILVSGSVSCEKGLGVRLHGKNDRKADE